MNDKSGKQAIEYGIVPIDVMASMSGLDFVRAIFARRLPEPPIMQTVEPFDCTVESGIVVIHSAGSAPLQSDRLGAWRLCRDPPGFRDGARGAKHAARGHWLHHAGIQDLIRARHERDERRYPHRGPSAQRRPPRRYRRGAHHRCKGSAACACDGDVPCVRISEGERERLTLNWRVGKATLMPLAPRTSGFLKIR
jgi:hypothetical protein